MVVLKPMFMRVRLVIPFPKDSISSHALSVISGGTSQEPLRFLEVWRYGSFPKKQRQRAQKPLSRIADGEPTDLWCKTECSKVQQKVLPSGRMRTKVFRARGVLCARGKSSLQPAAFQPEPDL